MIDKNIDNKFNILYQKKGYKPLVVYNDSVIVYNKGIILLLDKKTFKTNKIVKIPSIKLRLLSKSRLLTRLLRLEPRAPLAICERYIIFSLKGKLYKVDINNKKIKTVYHFKNGMSAPLYTSKIKELNNFEDMIVFGDYLSNDCKDAINIYASKDLGNTWEVIYTFSKGEINHIHNIIPDYYSNKVWILTGDTDDSSSIWYSDNGFKNVVKFIGGTQQQRSCFLTPFKNVVYYSTDTPLEDNHIYTFKDKERIKREFPLEGSVIYGVKTGSRIIMSTAVEFNSDKNNIFNLITYKRGKGIKSWDSSLIIYDEINSYRTIAKFKKDILPMGLFQFGTITFPYYYSKDTNKEIIFYGIGLKKIDGKMIIIKENENENSFTNNNDL